MGINRLGSLMFSIRKWALAVNVAVAIEICAFIDRPRGERLASAVGCQDAS
jgi:hypothetical protein